MRCVRLKDEGNELVRFLQCRIKTAATREHTIECRLELSSFNSDFRYRTTDQRTSDKKYHAEAMLAYVVIMHNVYDHFFDGFFSLLECGHVIASIQTDCLANDIERSACAMIAIQA